MTPEAQRIAIAEACGLNRIHAEKDDDGIDLWANADFQFIGSWKTGTADLPYHGRVPDYPNSLDAMHEAEKVMNANQEAMYYDKLCGICGTNAYRATAAQRAEAFLRTLGKWEDGK